MLRYQIRSYRGEEDMAPACKESAFQSNNNMIIWCQFPPVFTLDFWNRKFSCSQISSCSSEVTLYRGRKPKTLGSDLSGEEMICSMWKAEQKKGNTLSLPIAFGSRPGFLNFGITDIWGHVILVKASPATMEDV